MALNLWYSSCHGLLCAAVTSMTSMAGWGPRLLGSSSWLHSVCGGTQVSSGLSCTSHLHMLAELLPAGSSVDAQHCALCCPLDSNCVVNPKLLPALTPLSEDSCLVWVPPTVWWLISTLNLTGHRNVSALMRWDFGVHLQRLFQGD